MQVLKHSGFLKCFFCFQKNNLCKNEGVVTIRKKIFTNVMLALLSVLFLSLVGCGKTSETPQQQSGKEEIVSADKLIEKGKIVDGYSYDYLLTMPTGEKITHKMWVEPGKMRSEMKNPVNGQNMISIVNIKDNTVYLYQPELKQATKMKFDLSSEEDTTSPVEYLDKVDPAGMMFMKREVFDGKDCIVYESNIDGSSGKMWIWEEKGMPLRVETQSGQEKVVVEFLNFIIGDIDDSVFELPTGTRIVDMSSLTR